jgi:hypothetical protein
MDYRKLRVAWSVGWGVLCLLLIVLWVRSYWTVNILISPWMSVGSFPARIGMEFKGFGDWDVYSLPTETWRELNPLGVDTLVSGGFVVLDNTIFVPYWFILILLAVLGAAPWLPGRFSLRTLLIATTLVAVALGLIFAL